MRSRLIQVADDFWNIRGSFKIGGVIDIGTQASLVRRRNGGFVFLDSYSMSAATKRKIDALTNDGRDVEGILNLHPFHTVHVRRMHALFPDAKLFGAARHHAQAPDLDWQKQRTDQKALHKLFADDIDFSVPRGVDFVSDNDTIHFSSVLAYHRASKTIHVDDTFMYVRLPLALSALGLTHPVSFHPTLARALEKRAGAAQEFEDWAEALIDSWRDAENLCAAHTAALVGKNPGRATIEKRLRSALDKVRRTLAAHRRKYG